MPTPPFPAFMWVTTYVKMLHIGCLPEYDKYNADCIFLPWTCGLKLSSILILPA